MLEPPPKRKILSTAKNRKRHQVVILGYVIEPEFLIYYCHHRGLEHRGIACFNDNFEALMHILKSTGLSKEGDISIALVKADGKLDTMTYISIAHNKTEKGLKLPAAEKIEKLKEALETTEKPQWYIKC